jgi:arabinan endo-1,5-alpha-L-arabinosidase
MQDISTAHPGTLTHLAENITTYDSKQTNVGANPLEGFYQFVSSVNNSMQHYLFFSSGACCKNSSVVPLGDEYKVMVCRCLNPTGPFSDRDGKSCLTENGGTMILGGHDDVYAPGGQGLIYDEVLDSVILLLSLL